MLFISFLIGIIFGVFFFGGLQLTLKLLEKSRHPAVLMLSSMILRMAGILSGFWLLADNGNWYDLLAALMGVVLVRIILVASATAKLNSSRESTSNKEEFDEHRSK